MPAGSKHMEYNSLNCVDIAGTEMASILSTKDGGTVYFFSMATSFTAAALGAEGVGIDRCTNANWKWLHKRSCRDGVGYCQRVEISFLSLLENIISHILPNQTEFLGPLCC